MEFTLDDDQQALQRTVRSFLAEQAPSAYVRGDGRRRRGGQPTRSGSSMVELGWVGLLVPEAHGGAGMGLLEMMVVLEEMGRLPLPGPFLSSAVLATLAARGLGLDDRLASLASGADARHRRDRRGRATATWSTASAPGPAASRASGGSRGTKSVVLDGHTADWVLVAGPHAAGHRHVPDRGAPRPSWSRRST